MEQSWRAYLDGEPTGQANLYEADLDGANLNAANLERANLEGQT